MVVSQFTLHAMTKKGNRPSFIRAARPVKAIPLYELFLSKLAEISGREVQCGEFGAMMDVELINDGIIVLIEVIISFGGFIRNSNQKYEKKSLLFSFFCQLKDFVL